MKLRLRVVLFMLVGLFSAREIARGGAWDERRPAPVDRNSFVSRNGIAKSASSAGGKLHRPATPQQSTAPSGPPPVSYITAGVYQNGNHTRNAGVLGAAFGDFNGDGHLDMVTVDGTACISVLPGDGKGGFNGTPIDTCGFPIGGNARIVVGDFNGDGTLDVAVLAQSCCSPNNLSIAVAQGNGNGTFTIAGTMSLSAAGGQLGSTEETKSFNAADLNGDKKLDLVLTTTGNPNGSDVYVFLGDGKFGFTQSQFGDLGTCSQTNGAVIADFNHDGIPDLAVTNTNCGLSEVEVMLGKGDGSFEPYKSYPTDNGGPGYITTGDFNGDGLVDIVVVTHVITTFLGNGDGTFSGPFDSLSQVPDGPVSVAVGDFNGDGKDDLVSSSNGEPVDAIQLSNGDGKFGDPTLFAVLPSPTLLYVEDLNGDKSPDWISLSNGSENFCVGLGSGTGGFLAAAGIYTTPSDSGATDAIVAADFDQNGNLDYATVGWDDLYPGVNISFGDGSGNFAAPVHYAAGSNPIALTSGNFKTGNSTGSKFPDIAVLDQSNGMVSVLLNNGDGTLANAVSYAVGAGSGSIQTADFNRDGSADLIVTNTTDGTVSVLLGNGDGTFKPQLVSTSQAGAGYLAIADFNGDSIPDAVVATYSPASFSILLGKGDGTFQPPTTVALGSLNVCGIAAADLNKDSRADLVVCEQLINNGSGGNGGVAILLGNGDGTFPSPVTYPTVPAGLAGNPVTFGIPRVGDLNHDGNLDIVIPNQNVYASGVNLGPAILLGNGDGTFTLNSAHAALSGTNQQDIALGDFNNDGFLDMIVQNFNPGAAFDSVSSIAFTLLSTSSSAVIVRSAPNPSVQGQSVIFTAGVASSFVGLPLPTGNITFEMGSTNVTVPLVNDVATFTTSTLPVGSTIVSATYSGDANYNPNLSLGLTQTVTPGPLTITTSSLPNAVQNLPYASANAIVAATGGNPPYSFSLSSGSGSLPPGLTLASNGSITGTPSGPLGASSFTVQVQDSESPVITATANLQITVTAGTPASITATSGTAQSATVNTTFAAPLAATVKDGSGNPISGAAVTFTAPGTGASGTFAGGVNTATTNASGVATSALFTANGAAGNYTVTASVPGVSGTATFSLTNISGLTITTTSLANGAEGTSYNASVAGTGGVPPYTFSLATGSSLPAGLTLSPTGAITGTPTAPGTSSFTVQAKDSNLTPQTATATLSITITSNLAIITTSLQNGVVGNSYNATVTATGGNLPVTFSLAAGSSLPAGLSLNSTTGVISGVPSAAGASNFTVQVKDSSTTPQTVTANLSITITAALAITTPTLPNGVEGSAYNASVTATGGIPSYTFSLAAGSSLPSGLSISTGGVISGTPTTPGTTNFTVQAKDSSVPAQTATATLSITITSNLAIITTSLQNGVVGNSYNATVTATGGNLPETFSLAAGSSLPAGLTLSASGTISGKPTAPGTTTFTVQVKDSSTTPQTVAANLSITITSALAITTATLPNGIEGSAYNASVTATGGVPSYTFSLATGSSLPAGLTLNPTGAITGTPTAPGTASFTVQVKDSAVTPQTATTILSITITTAGGAFSITTTSLPNAVEASPYSASISATGGVLPYTFAIISPSLPSGMTLSSSGVISGTPSAPGTSNFTVQAKDSSPTPQTATSNLSITVASILEFTTTTLPTGVMGDAYNAMVTAIGGNGAYTFSLTGAGALPAGLSLSASGAITGKPTSAGTSTFTLQVKDSSAPPRTATARLSITVNGPLVITTTSLPPVTISSIFRIGFYQQVVQAQGGLGPFSFSLAGGSLPPGLIVGFAGATGLEETIIGGETASGDTGTYTFVIQVSDSLGDVATAPLSITIAPPFAIATTTLPAGTVGSAYNAAVTAIGGAPPYTFSATGLPAGLSMSSGGSITGTPTTTNLGFFFTVHVKDSTGTTSTSLLSIVVAPATPPANPLLISTTSLPTDIAGTFYSAMVTATGGTGPYTFSIIGAGRLPSGLSMSSSGTITGTPRTIGTSRFTVQVKDSSSTPQTATAALSIEIVTSNLQITTTSLPGGVSGTPYSATVSASGGAGPYTFSIVGAGPLPAGLSIGSSGTITGTPSITGRSRFTVQVTDSSAVPQTAASTLSITITSLLQITTTSLPGAYSGRFAIYSAPIAVVGGIPGYVFSITSGSLPAGLTLQPGGVIEGLPTAAGTSNFTVQVQDSSNPHQTASANLSIIITAFTPVTITTTSLPSGVVGSPYSAKVVATGGIPPYRFGALGGLPGGLSLSTNGMITGTPTTAGTFSFLVEVNDSGGFDLPALATLSITINSSGGTGGSGGSKLAITTTTLPEGGQGLFYIYPIGVTGGLQPYTFSATNGTLPPGLTISQGNIQGTPETRGTWAFTLVATDSGNPQQRATARLSITVVAGPRITTTRLPVATVNVPYSATINVTGGTPPYVFNFAITITGPTTDPSPLAPGLVFTTDGSNGVLGIGGTPNGPAGTDVLDFTVTDAKGLTTHAMLNLVVQ